MIRAFYYASWETRSLQKSKREIIQLNVAVVVTTAMIYYALFIMYYLLPTCVVFVVLGLAYPGNA